MLIWRRQPLQAGNFADETDSGVEVAWPPPLDIFESPDEFVLVFSLPGVPAEDIDLTVHGRVITVAGRRNLRLPDGCTALLLESARGPFLRRIRIPLNGALEAVSTTLSDGHLVVHIPKASSRPVRVPVAVGEHRE